MSRDILRNAFILDAIERGDFDAAIESYRISNPELFEDPMRIDYDTVSWGVDNLIEMADLESFDPEDRSLGFVWGGVIDGLLVKNSSNTSTRLETQINQLFIQSPYLQK